MNAIQKYRIMARAYDLLSLPPTYLPRALAISRLQLQSGGVVIDAGCGTGLNFPLIETRIGPQGRLIGVDISRDMLARAQRRVERHGWQNVTLIESPLEDAHIPTHADGALFSLVHDITQSPSALENVVGHLKPGGRVAAFGSKWAPWWLAPLNILVWLLAQLFITNLDGLGQPWKRLQGLVPNLRVRDALIAYSAWGTVAGPSDPAET